MSRTPEGRVKQAVKYLLDVHGAWHNWPVPGGYGASMLDCIGFHRGAGFAVETKAPGGKLTPRQQFCKEEMEKAGGKVFVIDAVDGTGIVELEAWLLFH